MKYLQVILLVAFSITVMAQALPIAVDENFSDWTSEAQSYTDTQNDGADYDLLSFSVSNDEDYLYIRFSVAEEVLLNDGHGITLEIDTDNDSETGYLINGIGAELGWFFGDRFGYFTAPAKSRITVDQGDIGFMALPTVSSVEFEMALDRNALLAGDPLFQSETIKICFYDNADPAGDYMPNEGETFSYTFDDETVIPDPDLIDLNKENSGHIRLMTYNTLYDGLIDPDRQDEFQRILQAVSPDIVTFNECTDTYPNTVKALLNEWLPVSGGTWDCIKSDYGNITCSVFPITDTYRILPGHRLTAALIDLPEQYGQDLLSINAHLKCCGGEENNATRQEEADAFAAFILDAKTPGGQYDLPDNTPFVLSGDLNLVGYRQQLTTMTNGDIQDTNNYGEGAPLDWDNSNLTDLVSHHSDTRFAFTWRDDDSFWPGRLDFTIYSDAVLDVAKAYTLSTAEMSQERLETYGLLANDTEITSDHLPKVTDFVVNGYTATEDIKLGSKQVKIIPKSYSDNYELISNSSPIQAVKVFNIAGQPVFQKSGIRTMRYELPLSQHKHGVYIVWVKTESFTGSLKFIYQ